MGWFALSDPEEYPIRYPECDINGDGSIDALDIEPFLDLLLSWQSVKRIIRRGCEQCVLEVAAVSRRDWGRILQRESAELSVWSVRWARTTARKAVLAGVRQVTQVR